VSWTFLSYCVAPSHFSHRTVASLPISLVLSLSLPLILPFSACLALCLAVSLGSLSLDFTLFLALALSQSLFQTLSHSLPRSLSVSCYPSCLLPLFLCLGKTWPTILYTQRKIYSKVATKTHHFLPNLTQEDIDCISP